MIAMSPIPSYVTHHFGLVFDDTGFQGWLRSVEGGAIKADLVQHPVGARALKDKRIGLPSYDPFNIQVGMSMAKPLYQWIEKSWAGEVVRKTGAIVHADRNLAIRHEQHFDNALITETILPALDGSSKEPANLGIKFQAESLKNIIGKGDTVSQDLAKNVVGVQKQWLPANFRFVVDGLDAACKRVNKVDSFTVKQGAKRLEVGAERVYQLEPASLEFPNLSATFSIADADKWFQWHEDFVVKGNNNTEQEKTGHITYLTPSLEEICRIDLYGVGIHNLTVEKSQAQSGDQIKRVKVELYVERMEFKWDGGGGSAGSPRP
jgi:hypothetical protein